MNSRIKKHLLLLLLLLAIAQNSQAKVENLFRAGIEAYQNGEFTQASQTFRDSLAEQPAAGTLLNLGLAEWHQGRVGQAMLAWEQATWLDPFNRDARNNLLYARETLQINPPELTWFEQASTWLPANLWTWIAGGSLWLAVGMVTVPGFFRLRKADWHQTLAALALGVFLLSLAPSAGIVTRSKIGIVTENNTSLRLTPAPSSEVITSLPPGEPVRELRRRGNYLFVHTQNGNGWVERRQIGFVIPRTK